MVPVLVNVNLLSGVTVGPPVAAPVVVLKVAWWIGQTRFDPRTDCKVAPRCVQVELKALKTPAFGCVIKTDRPPAAAI